MDGEPSTRASELIARNCIHAGVVHAIGCRRCLLSEVPLDAPLTVHVDGSLLDTAHLRELELDGERGPAAAVGWLARQLGRHRGGGDSDWSCLQRGTLVLTATPGGLHPITATQATVRVEFAGLVSTCTIVHDQAATGAA